MSTKDLTEPTLLEISGKRILRVVQVVGLRQRTFRWVYTGAHQPVARESSPEIAA